MEGGIVYCIMSNYAYSFSLVNVKLPDMTDVLDSRWNSLPNSKIPVKLPQGHQVLLIQKNKANEFLTLQGAQFNQ